MGRRPLGEEGEQVGHHECNWASAAIIARHLGTEGPPRRAWWELFTIRGGPGVHDAPAGLVEGAPETNESAGE